MNTVPIKHVVCVGLSAAGQAVSYYQKCSLLQALQTNGIQVSVSCTCTKCSMLWIPIGFSADPDPAFYLHTDPDPDPESQINTDPDPSQTLKSQKV
jgi:hypothetical protein